MKTRKKRELGLSLLEYAIGAAILAGVVILSMNTLGDSISQLFNNIAGWLNGLSGGLQGGN